MLILADSGILLRLFDPIDRLRPVIDAAVSVLQLRGDGIAYALQNAAEFWNVCTRPATSRGGLGLDITETERRLRLIEATFSLLVEPPGVYALWRSLVSSHSVKGRQVHDARLAALMQAHGMTHILTLNGADFSRYPGIVAIDPMVLASPPPAPSP